MQRVKSISDLALSMIEADQTASEDELARRLKAQVKADKQMLAQALQAATLHEIRLARGYLMRRDPAYRKQKQEREKQDQEMDQELTALIVKRMREWFGLKDRNN